MGDFLYLYGMNYKQIHDSIIDRAKTRVLPKETYSERHHIIPRCMGGSNDKSNLVDLTAKEHCIIHKLLHTIHPNNSDLAYAYWAMVTMKDDNNRDYKISAREYETIRKVISGLQSQRVSGENHPFYGTKRPEFGLKMSGENNPKWNGGSYSNCKCCDVRIYKTNNTCMDCRDLKGEKNGMYKKTNLDVWSEKYGETIAKQKWEEQQSKGAKSRIGVLAGEKNPNYGKVGELNAFYNKKHTQEVIENNRELAKQRTGFNGQRTKIIINPYTGVFYTAEELGDLFGVSRGYISRLIRNEQTVSKLKEMFVVV